MGRGTETAAAGLLVGRRRRATSPTMRYLRVAAALDAGEDVLIDGLRALPGSEAERGALELRTALRDRLLVLSTTAAATEHRRESELLQAQIDEELDALASAVAESDFEVGDAVSWMQIPVYKRMLTLKPEEIGPRTKEILDGWLPAQVFPSGDESDENPVLEPVFGTLHELARAGERTAGYRRATEALLKRALDNADYDWGTSSTGAPLTPEEYWGLLRRAAGQQSAPQLKDSSQPRRQILKELRRQWPADAAEMRALLARTLKRSMTEQLIGDMRGADGGLSAAAAAIIGAKPEREVSENDLREAIRVYHGVGHLSRAARQSMRIELKKRLLENPAASGSAT